METAGALAPGKWRWLRATGWMLAVAVAVVLTYNVVGKGVTWAVVWAAGEDVAKFADVPESYKLLGVVAGAIGAYAAYALAVRWGEKRAVNELALRPLPVDYLVGGAIRRGPDGGDHSGAWSLRDGPSLRQAT